MPQTTSVGASTGGPRPMRRAKQGAAKRRPVVRERAAQLPRLVEGAAVVLELLRRPRLANVRAAAQRSGDPRAVVA